MDDVNTSKHLVSTIAAVLLAAAIGLFWLMSGNKPDQPRAGTSATTEKAASSAGARMTPTEPKQVEPK